MQNINCRYHAKLSTNYGELRQISHKLRAKTSTDFLPLVLNLQEMDPAYTTASICKCLLANIDVPRNDSLEHRVEHWGSGYSNAERDSQWSSDKRYAGRRMLVIIYERNTWLNMSIL